MGILCRIISDYIDEVQCAQPQGGREGVSYGCVLCVCINTYHAAGVNRRHVKQFAKMFKNVNCLEFGDVIQNHHEKCIEISTNMASIGSLIPEIALTF